MTKMWSDNTVFGGGAIGYNSFAAGTRLLFSNNNQYAATLTQDGVLRVYKGTFPQTTISDDTGISTATQIWSSGAPPSGPLQPGKQWWLGMLNGVLSIYSTPASGPSLMIGWSNGSTPETPKQPQNARYLMLQDDGYLCTYEAPAAGLDLGKSVPGVVGTNGAVWHSTVPAPVKPSIPGSVRGVRVHNNALLVIYFAVEGFSNYDKGWSRNIAIGDYTTIDCFGSGPKGASVYPKAQWGPETAPLGSHKAGSNVVYDPDSNLYAVYNFTGSAFNPSFSSPDLSSDPS